MKVLAVIERPAVIRRILGHLGLPFATPRLRAPPDPPEDLTGDHPGSGPTNRALTTFPSLIL